MLSPKLICLFNLFFSCNLFLPSFCLLSFYQVISRNRFIFLYLRFAVLHTGLWVLFPAMLWHQSYSAYYPHLPSLHLPADPSLCIPPCLVIDHAHFRLSGGLCISRIHRPPIIGISRHHLPVLS